MQNQKKKLFIVDAMNLAHRCYWAYQELTTSQMKPTGMIYGSATFLTNLIQSYKPDYLVMCTDKGGRGTFRHKMYPEYKANRPPKAEELTSQIRDFYRLVHYMGIPLMGVEEYEADDIIGSLAKKVASSELEVYIVSSDKDFMQVIDPNISMLKPLKWPDFDLIGPGKVIEKFGVPPNQVIDVLALMGDASDNVPGVKGIGEKGAAKLIKTYGSLDGVYNNLSKVKGKKAIEGLTNNKPMAYLSKDLVTIRCDVPIHVTLEQMAVSPNALNNEKLTNFYKELEFDSKI